MRGAVDTNRVRIGIMEPSGAGSRRRLCGSLVGAEPSSDLTEIKKRLAEIRRRTLDEYDSLVRQFQSHAAGSPDLNLTLASTAADAVTMIRELAGDSRAVIVNRSGVVLNELRGELESSGFRLLEPYFDEADSFETKIGACWDLPGLVCQGLWPDFAVMQEDILPIATPSSPAELKDCVAVLGVNAAAAEDGSVFFLQHYSNITRALQQARGVVLVVALEKLVETREQAEFQTRCTAIFGLESMLLNLRAKKGSGNSWDELSPVRDDGQRTLHVIVLDNGRSQIANSDFRDLLLCIGCRACLRQCPIGLSMSQEHAIWSPRDYLFAYLVGGETSLDACLHCKACRIECPLSIDLPRLMWQAQAARKGRTLQQVTLGNPEALARAGSLTAPLSNVVLGHRMGRLIKAGLGLDAGRELPRFHRLTFRDWFASRKAGEAPGAGGRLLVYYAGCFANYYQPEVARATVRLLERNGCKVVLPFEKCCGLPMIANRNMSGFRRNAHHNINALAAAVKKGAEIVTACPSCALMLKKEYPELVGGDQALLVSEHTQYVDQYLMNWWSDREIKETSTAEARSVFYHVPCHLRALDGFEEFLGLWRHIPGLSVQQVNANCCGLGGYHGYKKAYSDQSREIGGRLFAGVKSAGADLVVSSCAACRLQIAQNTGARVYHPVQLLEDGHTLSPDASGEGGPRSAGG